MRKNLAARECAGSGCPIGRCAGRQNLPKQGGTNGKSAPAGCGAASSVGDCGTIGLLKTAHSCSASDVWAPPAAGLVAKRQMPKLNGNQNVARDPYRTGMGFGARDAGRGTGDANVGPGTRAQRAMVQGMAPEGLMHRQARSRSAQPALTITARLGSGPARENR